MNKKSSVSYLFLILIASIIASCANTEQNMREAEAIRNFGEALIGQGNYNAALNEFFKAEQLYEKDPYLHNDMGIVYLSKGKLDLAQIHFQKAIELKPDYPDALNNLGIIYLELRRWDDAIQCFVIVLDNLIYATPSFPLANMGWAYYNKGEYQKALIYYQKAVNIEPKFAIALRGLGKTYIALGQFPNAVQHLENTVKYAPNFTEAYMDLGLVYSLQYDFPKAIECYQKAIALAPNNEELVKKAQQEIQRLQPNELIENQ